MYEPLKGKITIVDDDNEMRSMLEDYFHAKNYEVNSFTSAVEAFDKLKPQDAPEIIISDIRMPRMDGIEFVSKIKEKFPETLCILITAFGSIETAIEAIKRGAYDYITKPFKLAALEVIIEKAINLQKLKRENKILRTTHKSQQTLEGLLGKSAAMQEVFDVINRVAPSMANILISGESGTGKELVARAIHSLSPRGKGAFVAINCTAIPEGLLESELFGHVKGAFTGAYQNKKGLFEEADGGTLFLDEIGDLDTALQAKLLRVLQERKIKPVGDVDSKPIDVRVIAATHKDLRQAIRNNQFREDLYYRLAVVPVNIPPLRYRNEDIPILVQHFLEKYCVLNHLPMKKISADALNKLLHARWEGNVRELENVIERLVILSRGLIIEEKDIQLNESGDTEKFFGKIVESYPSIEDLEKRYIQYILNKTGGKKEKASQILGINRRTLYRKEREYGFVDIDHEMEMEH
jgi:DNA-binding NtrC family response regulator